MKLSRRIHLHPVLWLAVTALPIVLIFRLNAPLLATPPALPSPTKEQATETEIANRYGELPLSFESNEGQTNREVKFLSRGPGYDVFLTPGGAVLTLRKPQRPAPDTQKPGGQPVEASVLRLKMIGANSESQVRGEDQLPGKINYLIGDDPHEWHVNIPTYRKVYYKEIYPKVDLVYYGNRTELEYDFVVAAGGDLRAIKFRLEGTDRIRLDDAGDLRFGVKDDEVTLHKPTIYQLDDSGNRVEVNSEYVIKDTEVSFKTDSFDERKPLVIDPVLSYSTLLGGSGGEFATSIAIDSTGSAYITGTTSGGFPTTPGSFQTDIPRFMSAFVTKLDPTGSTLIYSTYLNGSNDSSEGKAIGIDSSGNAYVTGRTKASDFPTVNPIRSSTSNFYKSPDSGGHWNPKPIDPATSWVNVLAVDPLSTTTMYAGVGCCGGSGIYKTTDAGESWNKLNTGVPNGGSVVVVVDPVTPATLYASIVQDGSSSGSLYKSTDGGNSWAILTNGLAGITVGSLAIDPTSPSTLYAGSTFIGLYKSTNGGASWVNSSTGLTFGGPTAIVVDPITPQTVYAAAGGGGVFRSTNGGANWKQVNNGLTTTTVHTLKVDPTSTVYAGTSGGGVFKSTDSGNNWNPANSGFTGYMQVSAMALSSTNPATLFLSTANGRIFKTTDGGSNWIKVYETLTKTNFASLAIAPGGTSTVYAGVQSCFCSLDDYEGFVSKLNSAGSALIYSTYLGGSADDFPNGIAVDSNGSAIVVGQTFSDNFPTKNATKPTFTGPSDAFLTKFNPTGDALQYSTFLGGGGVDIAYGVATDASNNAYVTGSTNSVDFPILNAFQPVLGDTSTGDAFVTKVNGSGAFVYSTYLGGEFGDYGSGIAVDLFGNAYITGSTGSSGFPLVNPFQSTNRGGTDAFVTKLNSTGSGLVYSTYLGGSSNEFGASVAVDSIGNAYVAGSTRSTDFPLIAGALRTKSPIFTSTNGGSSWSNDNYGLMSEGVNVLALDPSTPRTVYAGTRNDVFKSTDGGQNWNTSSNGLASPAVRTLVVNPTLPSTLYLGIAFGPFGASAGVYKSTDAGSSWNAVNTGLTNTSVLSLAIDPITPSTLYAGVYGLGIFKSVDGGAHWTLQGNPQLTFIQSIVIDPITPTTIYAGSSSSGGGVFKSTDAGTTWQSANSNLSNPSVLTMAIDPQTPSTLYLGADLGMFKSQDGAASWTFLKGDSGHIVVDPVTPSIVYTVSTLGISRSSNGGNNWTPINNGLSYNFDNCLVINPTHHSTLIVGVTVFPPDDNGFVVKLSPSGASLVYSTLLGGTKPPDDSSGNNTEANSIAVDLAGNAYVVGATLAPDFQVTPNAFQPFNRGGTDAFITKLMMSYFISGTVRDGSNAPVSGAVVTLSDGATLKAVVTESDGAYRFSGLREGGNFTLTATKPHLTMTPSSQTFNDLHANQVVNFIAAPTNAPFYSITGAITNNGAQLEGVTVTLGGSQLGITTTDVNGSYSFTLAGGGNYTVSPSLLGFVFTPASRMFNNLSADQTADFAATRQDFVVTNANDHGPGSLRQAMLNANATVGLDTIVFNIPGGGVKTISLLIPLPEITDPVVIDAATQPGYAGAPLVELIGTRINNSAGFRSSAGGSTIRGFAIGSFVWGIFFNGGDNYVIQGNYIGIDATGILARSNDYGIIILDASNSLIGGTSSAARNVISGNEFNGMELRGPANQVQGNFIGTNPSGTAEMPNGINGISVGGTVNSDHNTIGGTAPGAGNLISGNQTGISCSGTGNKIQGNLIGTDVTGTVAISNITGIDVQSTMATIGGLVAGARNIISGNTGDGLKVAGVGTVVQGNFIGLDITGTAVLRNAGSGIVAGNQAMIGGTTPEARNVISGNGGFGNISIGSNISGEQVTVQGNYIGTDVTGNVALSNPVYGIAIHCSFNVIGGLSPGTGNIIAGNQVGIQIGGSTTREITDNIIQGNIIGLNASATAPLPNTVAGIQLTLLGNTTAASNHIIGGIEPGAGNLIGFNNGPGVSVNLASSTGISIRGNSIFSNTGLGIDLAPTGINGNDSCDADTGANNRQNYPIITSVLNSAGTTEIDGTLNSTANTLFRVDFYSSPSCHPSGRGEGKTFIGSATTTTDSSCNATVKVLLPVVDAAMQITATATDPNGNTSEFSPCQVVCSYQLPVSSASFSVNGGTGSADVTCTTGCSWSAISNDSWITITSGASGNGNGSVGFSVGANATENPRTGTLTIATQTFTVNQSADPTAVKIESFSSRAYDGGVFIEWKTGFEVGNLGFYIYRERGGQKTRITPEIVAGSALIAGDKTRLTAGLAYRWWDSGADCGSKVGDCRDVTYWLEDIGVDGVRTQHGPIKPSLVGGPPPQQSTAALLSKIGSGEPTTGRLLVNQPSVAGLRAQNQTQDTRWDFASKSAVKMTISEEGWYRVSQSELLAAGLDPKCDPRYLQLYLNGIEQALLVTGEQDGHFDQSDAIAFYAAAQDSRYANASVYWLVSGERSGKRIPVIKNEAKPGGASGFRCTVEHKDRTTYFASLLNGEAENFFGRVVTSESVDQDLTLHHIDTTVQADAVLEIALQGVTDLPGIGPDHRVTLTLNGTRLASMIFDGRQHAVERFTIPQTLLREGANVVNLVADGSSDISLVDYILVTYQHAYTAEQDALKMSADRAQTIEGFSDASIRVLDVTNPSEPEEIVGQIEERKQGDFAITIQPPHGDTRTLIAFTANRRMHPISIFADRQSILRESDHNADLLIITNHQFAEALSPLKALRQKQGLVVEMVDVEDIYDEFNFGQKSPIAIKDFLSFVRERSKKTARFVLFAGAGSYDPRNYLGFGDSDFVPTKLIDTAYLETASDDWFVDFDDDGIPEMFVGRLPVRTASEAASVVSKLIAYDSTLKQPSARRSVLLVADRNDGFNFEQASEQLRAFLPPTTSVREIFRGRLEDEFARKQLIDAINQGQSIVNYTGHGSTNVWRSLFTTGDVGLLTNQRKLPLFVAMTCLNGFFQDPLNESLGASLLTSAGGGAIAVWASSGMTMPTQQALMNQQLYRVVFSGGATLRLGEITSRAKASVSDTDIRRTWILIGDPTMVLR